MNTEYNETIQVLTIAMVAEIIGSNRSYVRNLIKSGQLKAMKLGNLKVSSFELKRFLQASEGLDLTDPFNPKPLAV